MTIRTTRVLINDLLSFSRIARTAQPFVSVDLDEVLKEVISDLEIRVQETNARIELSNLPTIEADPLQIRQLMQNVLANALKHRREGVEPIVTVAAEMVENAPPPANGDARRCRITVADNGIGFDEEYTDRIFGIFQRLYGRTEYEGSGMGLAICRKIAERHGRSIVANSRPEEGAIFTITLPVEHHEIGTIAE